MGYNTVFVLTEMRLGGRERVVSNVAGLLNLKISVAIFSVWKNDPVFKSDAPIYFDINTRVNRISQPNRNSIGNKTWMKPVIKVLKNTVPYHVLQKKRLDSLIEFLKENNVKNVVLTDLTTTFAPKIRKAIPEINIISWIHMQQDAFFNIQYKSYQKELKKGLSFVNKLVALTPKQATDYRKYVPTTTYIPNPMPELSTTISNLNSKTILIVSRIDIQHKGLDFLTTISEYIPKDWQIKVVGSGGAEDEKIFSDIVKSSKNKISWQHAVDGDKLVDMYKNASIFIMPSRFEGFPLTLGEAMSHGLPIVAFDLDGTRTVLKNEEDNVGLLVPMGDVNEFGKTLRILINDYDRRKKLSILSRLRARDFSEDSIMKMWLNLLNNK